MDPLSAPRLLAEIETGVLVRSLAIAAVLVTPYGLYKRHQVRARRAAVLAERGAATTDDAPAPARPRLEDVIDGLARTVEEARAAGTATVMVPSDVTVGGQDAPAELVDSLVRDALRRSGLAATAEVDTAEGRVIECMPVAASS